MRRPTPCTFVDEDAGPCHCIAPEISVPHNRHRERLLQATVSNAIYPKTAWAVPGSELGGVLR